MNRFIFSKNKWEQNTFSALRIFTNISVEMRYRLRIKYVSTVKNNLKNIQNPWDFKISSIFL